MFVKRVNLTINITSGAWLYWRTFKVLIAVTVGVTTLVIFTISLLMALFPAFKSYVIYLLMYAT